MKKVFTILGVIFAVILVTLVIVAAIFIPRALKLDREATAYLQEAIPKIVTTWSSQELIDRATPQLLAEAPRDKVDRLFEMFQRLGSFKRLDKPEGAVASSTFSGTGTVTLGNYKIQAEFEKGTARIEVQLRRVNDTWKINAFHIYSDALLPPKT